MENEVRLIDKDALIDDSTTTYISGNGYIAIWRIDEFPEIDPESLRPKGRWEKYWCESDLIGHMYEVCPNCRSCEILDTDKFWDSNYCPNCGAKMEV